MKKIESIANKIGLAAFAAACGVFYPNMVEIIQAFH